MSAAITFTKESDKLARLSTYEQRLNRGIHKNLTALRELQAERIRNHERDLQEEATIARAKDINGLPYKAPAWPSRNGYVFSTGAVLAAANRQSVTANATSLVKNEATRIQFAGASDNMDPHGPTSGLKLVAAA